MYWSGFIITLSLINIFTQKYNIKLFKQLLSLKLWKVHVLCWFRFLFMWQILSGIQVRVVHYFVSQWTLSSSIYIHFQLSSFISCWIKHVFWTHYIFLIFIWMRIDIPCIMRAQVYATKCTLYCYQVKVWNLTRYI